jgi:hypothetical protein
MDTPSKNERTTGAPRLFRVIVTMGAALGAACGGTTAPAGPPDAAEETSADSPDSMPPRDALSEAFAGEGGGDPDAGRVDGRADAADGDGCAPPNWGAGTCSPACAPVQSCICGQCFPTFV